MKDLISRADAIEAVHKYFVRALNNEPHEIDEDGDDVFTDMKSVNALLHHNKYVSKALKELPSAEADCSTCKHKDKDWDSEECDSCCGNNNHYTSADAVSREDTVTLNSPISIQAEMVAVVRCKDCRFAMVRTKEEMNKPIKPQPILCEWLCIGVENDAYCSHGERREP